MAEWRQNAVDLFGPDPKEWAFKCPSCGHVQTVQDFVDVGASPQAANMNCIGRYLDEDVPGIWAEEGPCDYAGQGLFRLNPVRVVTDDGETVGVFAFASTESRESGEGTR